MANDKHRWNSAVRTLVENGDCSSVRWLLRNKNFYHTSLLQRGLQDIGQHASEAALQSLTPHLTSSQLETVLPEVVKRRLWRVVTFMCRRVTNTMRAFVVKEVVEHADNEHLDSILPHCTQSELDTVLTVAVSRGLWECVEKALCMCHGPGKERRRWVIQEAIEHGSDRTLSKLLRKEFCSRRVNDSMIHSMVQRHMWQSLLELLNMNMILSSEKREVMISEASVHATGQVVEDFVDKLGYRCEHLPDLVFQNLLERKLWMCVGNIMSEKLTCRQLTMIVMEGKRHGENTDITDALQRCPDNLSDHCVTETVRVGMWTTVAALLRRTSVSSKVRREAIQAAMKSAGNKEFCLIIQNCPFDLVDPIVLEAVERGLWSAVVGILSDRPPVGCTARRQAVQAILEHGPDKEFCSVIKSCPDVDSIVREAVKRRLWGTVIDVLRDRLVGKEAKSEAIQAILAQAQDKECCSLVDVCPSDLTDTVLRELVKRKLWSKVVDMLHCHAVGEEPCREAIHAILRHGSIGECWSLVNMCPPDLADTLLKGLVKRQLWRPVVDMLQCHTVGEVAEREATEAILAKAGDKGCCSLVKVCSSKVADTVLRGLVKRQLWRPVVDMLQCHTVGEVAEREAIEAILAKAGNEECCSVAEVCSSSLVDTVLIAIVGRKLWSKVVDMLQRRTIGEEAKRMSIQAAKTHVHKEAFSSLVRICPPDLHGVLMREALTRDVLNEVRAIVNIQTSHTSKQRLLEDAINHASESQIQRLLPLVDNDHLGPIVHILIARRLWSCVLRLVERGADIGNLDEVVVEASKDFSPQRLVNRFFRYCAAILSYPAMNRILQNYNGVQVSDMLETVVRKGMADAAWDVLLYIGEHGEPLAVSSGGLTVLDIVMKSKDYRRDMVSQCIMMGVTTHQRDSFPQLGVTPSGSLRSVCSKVSYCQQAVRDRDILLTRMLFESGVSNNAHMRAVHRLFSNSDTLFEEMHVYLRETATNPRSLKSLCRLLISHHLGVGYRRRARVNELPVPQPLKDYVIFSDLVN